MGLANKWYTAHVSDAIYGSSVPSASEQTYQQALGFHKMAEEYANKTAKTNYLYFHLQKWFEAPSGKALNKENCFEMVLKEPFFEPIKRWWKMKNPGESFPANGSNDKCKDLYLKCLEYMNGIEPIVYTGFYPDSETIHSGPIELWDVSEMTDMREIFISDREFDRDISGWNVSKVTNMRNMFFNAKAFNGDISRWDVSSVTNMQDMFGGAKAFNGDISGWDVSNVTNMRFMFSRAKAFNGDISGWNVSKVTNMRSMFKSAEAFNGDISGWDVSNVTRMVNMFGNDETKTLEHLSRWYTASYDD